MSIMGRAFLDNQEKENDRVDYLHDREKKTKRNSCKSWRS
jgi:hypothetical protein